jgi:phage terminase Nu1 subunit (DNA packaging protein)
MLAWAAGDSWWLPVPLLPPKRDRLVRVNDVMSGELRALLGVSREALSGLAKRGIVAPGKKRGTYQLQESVSSYCQHLRAMAGGQGGEAGASARERLGQAQATLAEVKAKQLSGELVEASEVEALWTSKLRAFRNRILAIPSRVRDLSARQSVSLTHELRGALTELADG